MSVALAPLPAPRAPESGAGRLDRPRAPGGLLVGADGRSDGAAALGMAAALAGRTGEAVHVIVAVDAPPVFAPGYEPVAPLPRDETAARQRQLRRLIAETVGDGAGWGLELRAGCAAPVLAGVAAERRARLLVVGLGLRRLRDRAVGGEPVLRIVRQSPVPVLAVAPDADRLPGSAVVGLDFGASSIAAAHAAAELVGEHGTLYLVHVRPPLPEGQPRRGADEPGYPVALEPWFERLVAGLAGAPRLLVRPVVLRGAVPDVLLDFAERVRAELVALGTQGTTPAQPGFVGSTTAAVVRGTRASALVAPANGRTC